MHLVANVCLNICDDTFGNVGTFNLISCVIFLNVLLTVSSYTGVFNQLTNTRASKPSLGLLILHALTLPVLPSVHINAAQTASPADRSLVLLKLSDHVLLSMMYSWSDSSLKYHHLLLSQPYNEEESVPPSYKHQFSNHSFIMLVIGEFHI